MPGTPPAHPKLYHIVHVDRLQSVIADGHLWCDAKMAERPGTGTIIGMNEIKERRMTRLRLASHPDLFVGQCVPFYFCPRSVMLFLIHKRNHPNLSFRGGQGPIVHLEADLRATVAWAKSKGRRWAFTLSNAGSNYFEDRASLTRLGEIDWDAIEARQWGGDRQNGKQAEFLIESSFPWTLVERIGVHSVGIQSRAATAIASASHRPPVEVLSDWYY